MSLPEEPDDSALSPQARAFLHRPISSAALWLGLALLGLAAAACVASFFVKAPGSPLSVAEAAGRMFLR